MGIYDRDYMAGKKEALKPAGESRYSRPSRDRAPLWTRIKFWLWLWWKGRR